MKRVIISLIIIFVFFASACVSTKPIQISDGAYNYTPDEFVDLMNSYAKYEAKENGSILAWPDYEESDVSMDIGDYLQYTLTENDKGYLTSIRLDWVYVEMTTQERNSLSFYFGYIFTLLSPENGKYVSDELNSYYNDVFSVHTVADNGTEYQYLVGGVHGDEIIIRPAA